MGARADYLDGAFKALANSTLEDLLDGLTIQRIAGMAHRPAKHFNHYWRGGKAELVDELVRRGVAPPVGEGIAIHEAIQRLHRALHDRRAGVLDDIREAARANFLAYNDRGYAGPALLGFLSILAAPNDPTARERVLAYYRGQTEQYAGMYDGVLLALGREPIPELNDGTRTLAILVTALFDGLSLRARFDDELDAPAVFADVVVPLVLALTRGTDERPLALDERLRPDPGVVGAVRGVEQTYASAIEALREVERTGGPSHIDVASLHGHVEQRHLDPSPHAVRLREEVGRLLDAGWSLRRLTSVASLPRLEAEEAAARELDERENRPRVEVRGFVTPSLPLLAPMIVGGRVVILGIEDGTSYGIASAVALRDPGAVERCVEYFEMLWQDERAIRLRTHAGMREAGFAAVRKAIAPDAEPVGDVDAVGG